MNDLQKLIDKVIDKAVVGCDTYKHNGSTWLLFTDDKKWVIELTKEGTLWYNYYFFQKLFKVIALDVVENQHYITKWVEDTVINGVKSTKLHFHTDTKVVEDTVINGVKDTKPNERLWRAYVEDTIQNGVKHTIDTTHHKNKLVEDTIQNGVKKTRRNGDSMNTEAEDVIQNGVKDTFDFAVNPLDLIEDTIQNGVKHISNRRLVVSKEIEDTIQNGVKRTLQKNINRIGQVEDAIKNGVKHTDYGGQDRKIGEINDIIENGVKHTIADDRRMGWPIIEDTIQNGVKRTDFNIYIANNRVEDTIQNGVKKTYSDKIPHEYDWSKQFTEEIDDIIQNGVKHTEKSLQIDGSCVIEDVIKEGVKHTEYGDWLDGDERFDDIIENGVKETHDDVMPHTGMVEGVIKNGVKECIPSRTPLYNPMDFSVQYRENHRLDDVASVLEKGIKEVQPLPSQEGNMDYSNYYYRQGDKTIPHTQYVDDVITNGIKKTKAMDEWVNTDRIVDGVISGGELVLNKTST